MTAKRVLGIFAKWPRAGLVKTRLARETSPEWAARVAEAFLRDTLARTNGVDARRVLVYTPESSDGFFTEHFAGISLEAQGDGDLGRRMHGFFARHLAAGDDVVVIGTDSPTLPVAHIEQAYDLLKTSEVVLGPALDGGYYLVGAEGQLPPMFDEIAWGTPLVLVETLARLDHSGVALLPPWYDVDTLADWRMLCVHIEGMRRAGIQTDLPHTEALIAESAYV